jgi:acyl-CoA synthetase (AMP-forming)/AMP-acid ligase II
MSSSPLAAATTLTALLESLRDAPGGGIHYHDSEHELRSSSFSQLYQRALGILYHLQRLGARPGDHLILLLTGNEPFIDAFWAAVLGGVIPVPVAPGISDEHRHKLLRIAAKLGKPFIYTEQRLLERVGTIAAGSGSAGQATFEALKSRARASCIGPAPPIPPSFSFPRAPPANRRVWCSPTPTCWPTFVRSAWQPG